MAHRKDKKKSKRNPAIRIALVGKLIQLGQDSLKAGKTKVSIADYVRTLNFQNEMDPPAPAPCNVTWVDTHFDIEDDSQESDDFYSSQNEELADSTPRA